MSRDERFRIYIAAYLVLTKNGRVLLSKRANTGYQDGNFSMIAGHLEGAETAKTCIMRESKEEANIDLKPTDLNVVHVMHRYRLDREYIDVYLSAEAWNGEIKNMEPNKCAGLEWFFLENLPNNILPEVKFALENIQNKIFYSEIGW